MPYIFLFIVLIFATAMDVKTRTIPLWLFPSTSLVSCLYMISEGTWNGYWNLIGFLCMLIPTFILGIAGSFGGADIIMFSSIGIILGKAIVPYVVIYLLSALFFLFYQDFRKRNIPQLHLLWQRMLFYLFLRKAVHKSFCTFRRSHQIPASPLL